MTRGRRTVREAGVAGTVEREDVMRLVGLLLTVTVCPGCASHLLTGTARTLPPGKLQLALAPEVYAFESAPRTWSAAPTMQVAGRVGVTERLDLGAAVSLLGFATDAKVMLVRSEEPESGFDLSVAPGVGYSMVMLGGGDFFAPQSTLRAELPVLFGVNFHGGHQLTVAPRLIYEYWVADGGLAGNHVLYAAGALAIAFKLVDKLRLMPSFSVAHSVWASAAPLFQNQRPFVFEGGLVLLIGGD